VAILPPLHSPPSPANRRKRFPFAKLGIGLALACGVGYTGWTYLPSLFSNEGGDVPLTAAVARDELKITVSDRGELESIDATTVHCELRGQAKLSTIVPEGTHVKKDSVVAQLDTDQFTKLQNEQRVKWEAAEGKVLACKSDLTQAESKAGTEIAKAELALKKATIALKKYLHKDGEYTKDREKLKGQLELAKKEMVEAEEDLEFTRKQLKKGFGDLSQVRAKELGLQQKQYNVKSAEAELRVLEVFTKEEKETELQFNAEDAVRELARVKAAQESAVSKAKSELRTAEATAKIEKDTLDDIQKQIDRCTLKAPSDGIVVYANARYWDESSRIRPGAQLYNQQPIFSLPDLSKMKVKVKIHESLVKKVRVGMPATLQIEALPNRLLHGKVEKIGTIAQADGWRGGGVKQYETEVSIDDLPTDAGLKPGMSAEVKILVNTLTNAQVVPVAAVTEYEGGRVVYVLAGRKVERRQVEVGESNDQFVQVLGGLNDGDAVALDARGRAAKDLKNAKPQPGGGNSTSAGPAS
jgi:HlyD family secretion protein